MCVECRLYLYVRQHEPVRSRCLAAALHRYITSLHRRAHANALARAPCQAHTSISLEPDRK